MHLDGPFCELNDFERKETFTKSDKKTYEPLAESKEKKAKIEQHAWMHDMRIKKI